VLLSLVTTRGTGLRVVEGAGRMLVSKRRVISFTLGFPFKPPFSADLVFSSPGLAPIGADADRYAGVVLKLLRA